MARDTAARSGARLIVDRRLAAIQIGPFAPETVYAHRQNSLRPWDGWNARAPIKGALDVTGLRSFCRVP